MRTTKYALFTLKNKPHNTNIISHELMLRSGMIRQLSSGIYIWLPTGLRVLKKIKNIIKKEMKKINGLEIYMPIIQPESLWKESGRLDIYGKELLKFCDRHNHSFILGPTNEEVATYLIKNERFSCKNFPILIYQIQTKFRDEIRPRFGIIRSKEFIMKDAYSFHENNDCLKKTYNILYNSYCNIFKKMNIHFYAVKADSGSMGGNISHEFQAISQSGEDEIVFSKNSKYSANINLATSIETVNFFKNPKKDLHFNKQSTKIQKTIIGNNLNIDIKNKVKTILVKTKNNKIAALLIRSDHKLNIFKLEKITILLKPITFLNEKEILDIFHVKKQFLGPLGLNILIIADISVYYMKNFSIGANINNQFFINVNWIVDLPVPLVKDIRTVTENDTSPDGKGLLIIKKSIEIGHIFQLEKKYSKNMNFSIKNKNGTTKNVYMGCYGIGITRIIATIIEQNHDDKGIIWPISIAPFIVAILPINYNENIEVKKISDYIYNKFQEKKIDVILDDRNIRTGIMFNDMDIIGIPHQIIISKKSINENNIEYRERKNKKNVLIKIDKILDFIIKKINY